MQRCMTCGSELNTAGCPICVREELETQKTPFKCPVCDGGGEVSRPAHIPGDQKLWSTGQTGPYICKACSGTGIVWG